MNCFAEVIRRFAPPPAMPTQLRRVALMFSRGAGAWQDVVRGVYRFAESEPAWQITLHAVEDVSHALTDGPDGVIAAVRTPEAAARLADWGGPVVNTCQSLDDLPFASVAADMPAAGRTAADHLAQLRGRLFAFAGDVATPSARLARQGFVGRLWEAGVVLPPLGVVTRRSTDAAAVADPDLAAALRFIRDRAANRVGVDDVAEASGLSRSSLERRFRATLGRSPLSEILRQRVERAKSLLADTDLAAKQVARAAGFRDASHLSVTFRRRTGMSPVQFRALRRGG